MIALVEYIVESVIRCSLSACKILLMKNRYSSCATYPHVRLHQKFLKFSKVGPIDVSYRRVFRFPKDLLDFPRTLHSVCLWRSAWCGYATWDPVVKLKTINKNYFHRKLMQTNGIVRTTSTVSLIVVPTNSKHRHARNDRRLLKIESTGDSSYSNH